MDVNHQDKTGNKPTASEIKLWLPPLSPKDQEKLDCLRSNRLENTIKHSRDHGYKVTEEYNGDTPGQLSKVSVEHPPRKTRWDWLQLLIIPLLIAGLGIGFTWVQNQTSLQIAKDNRTQDLQIAATRYANDQQLATDQQRETILKACLDDIKDLLLNKSLRASKPTDEVRVVARGEVLIALRQLDGGRKGLLIQFLSEAGLISTEPMSGNWNLNKVIIMLNNADLTGAYVSGAGLDGAHLRSANLSGAQLNDAHLSHADLTGAHLDGTNLRNADLSGADLSGANLKGAIGIIPEELEKKAASLKGAIMLDGSKHP